MKKLICLIVFTFFIISCSKEEFTIYEVPLEEIESSYFDYREEAVVLEYEELNSLLVDKNDNELVLQKSDLLSSLNTDNVIVSSTNTPHEEFILREVLEIIDNGNQLQIKTRPATIYQAYAGFYYDSRKNNTIILRDATRDTLYNLASLKSQPPASSGVNTKNIFEIVKSQLEKKLFDAKPKLGKAANFASKFSYDWNIQGSVEMESIHPNVQYVINNPSDSEFAGLNTVEQKVMKLTTLPDMDKDGISNYVENYYGTNTTDKTSLPIISKIFVNDFAISFSPKVKLGSEFGFKTDDFLTERKPPKSEVEAALTDSVTIKINLSDSPLQSINYVPIPGLTTGVFGLAVAWQPFLEFAGSINLELLVKIFTEPTDFVFGIIDFSRVNLEPEFRWESTDGAGNSLSLDLNNYLRTRLDVDMATILTAEAQLSMGFGLGLAAYAGETNSASIAFGGMITPYAYMKPSLKAGIGFNNILTEGLGANYNNGENFYAYGCLEFGPGVEIYAFTDGNDPTQWANFLDLKKTFYKQQYDVLKDLVGAQFCLGDTPCKGYSINKFNISRARTIDGDNTYVGVINAKPAFAEDKKYHLDIQRYNQTLLAPIIDREFEFGKDEIFQGTSEALDVFFSDDSYAMVITPINKPDCRYYITRADILLNYCDAGNVENDFYYHKYSGSAHDDLYMSYSNAVETCNAINKRLMTYEDIERLISFSNSLCIDATGYLVKRGGTLINKDKAWVWIQAKDPRSVAAIDIDFEPGGTPVYSLSSGKIGDFIPKASESVRMKCVCIDK